MSIILFFLVLCITAYVCYRIGRYIFQQRIFEKGYDAEDQILTLLHEWTVANNIFAYIQKCPIPEDVYKYSKYSGKYEYSHQLIDIVVNGNAFTNLGLEVKFINLDNRQYLLFDHISRKHSDGNRQSSKQLFSFIAKTNRLGLYVFVFEKNTSRNIYLLPHYVLEEMLNREWYYIPVEKIENHPHSYMWAGTNAAFIKYIEREYVYQQKFLNN